jgi:hypothetical protein
MKNEPKHISELLRDALPEALRADPAVSEAIDKVAALEGEHVQVRRRAELERRFLERAPREGLQYPGDALKLEDIAAALDTDDKGALDKLYRDLKARRPYLFRKPVGAPEKLASRRPPNEDIRQAWKGGLTRQVQIAREVLRRT